MCFVKSFKLFKVVYLSAHEISVNLSLSLAKSLWRPQITPYKQVLFSATIKI